MSEHHRGSQWAKVLRTVKPMVKATLPAPCIEGCGRMVTPDDQTWDLSHIVSVDQAMRMGWTRAMIDAPTNLGPAHRACNRSSGGKAGRAKQLSTTRQTRRLPTW